MERIVNPNWPSGLEDMNNTAYTTESRKNVIDYYKYWTTDAIKADLDTKRSPLVLLCENFAYDLNVASAIRNGNAFNVNSVWICGKRHWDRRGATGTHNYMHVNYSPDVESVIEKHRADGYRIVVADNLDGASAVDEYKWDDKTLLIMGQESIGVSQTALDLADDCVYIRQHGTVRSMNVASAAAIMLYSYSISIGQ